MFILLFILLESGDKMTRIYSLALVCVIALFGLSVIQNLFQKTYYPSVPQKDAYISDNSNIISKTDYESVNNRLNSVKSRTGVSVYIITIGNLSGLSLYSYGNNLAGNWGLPPDSNYILIIISGRNGNSAVIASRSMSSVIDFDTSEKIATDSGAYFKQYGTDTGMYYIYNNVIGFLCKSYNISNVYQYGSLPKIDSHKSISFWFVIFSILLMLLLAFFYGVSFEAHKGHHLHPGDEFSLPDPSVKSRLIVYAVQDSSILVIIILFTVLFGSYMLDISKFKEYLISIGIMLIIFAPVFEDFRKILIDIIYKKAENIEGSVKKTYWSFFRYYIIVVDMKGDSYIINSLKCFAKENDYIKAVYTQNIKLITYINIVHENIIL